VADQAACAEQAVMALLQHGLRRPERPGHSYCWGLDEPGAADLLLECFRIVAASKSGLLSSKGWRVVGKGFGLLLEGRGRWLPAG
jgi:hypothetical protein